MSTRVLDPEAVVVVRQLIQRARAVAVLTGAGVSAESGVPTFRGPGGLWRGFRPDELATPAAFVRNPALVWEWYTWRRTVIAGTTPNVAHRFLAELDRRVPAFRLATQNVDGLHARAGSGRLDELHGNIFRTACGCGFEVDESPGIVHAAPLTRDRHGVPVCPLCGSPMRPGVVWFGERLPDDVWHAAATAASGADVMIVIGTSGIVHPAAALPELTRRAGGAVIEINPEETALTAAATISIRGSAGAVCAALENVP